jgi:FAD/FMN-containing dehydrogenase
VRDGSHSRPSHTPAAFVPKIGDDPDEHIRWTREYWETIEPFTHGFYVNDLEVEHGYAAVAENYRQNQARLVAVKNRYDPGNLFRLNANVLPTV